MIQSIFIRKKRVFAHLFGLQILKYDLIEQININNILFFVAFRDVLNFLERCRIPKPGLCTKTDPVE